MGICCNGKASRLGMNTLGGDAEVWSSCGRRLGRRKERGRVRVCESVAQGGFACGGLLVIVHLWIA